MTTVAFDGELLASDRRMSTDNGSVATTKIVRARRWWYAQVGDSFDCERVREWLQGGAKPADRPELSQGEKSHGFVVEIRTGKVFLVDGKFPTLVDMETTRYAAGSGGDFARAAMELGKTAPEAVELAAKLDPSTGDGVNVVRVKRPRKAVT